MVCVYCSGPTQVINSRWQKRLNRIWRRRRCKSCASVFTTNEAPDNALAFRVASSGSLQAFDRDKLFISIYDSLRHRPSPLEDARSLTATVTSRLSKKAHRATIELTDIIVTTADTLKRFDRAAYTYYTAHHPRTGDR